MNSRLPASISLFASAMGLAFATVSTLDYASHLDRRLHDLHCSFVPGVTVSEGGDACRSAMYSPYSALLKESYWGGIPISLFAVGAFAFFLGFALYLLISGARAPKRAVGFFAVASTTPALVSLVMLIISATQIGSFCKTCVGIYVSSALLATGGLLGLKTLGGEPGSPASASSPYQAAVPAYAGRPQVSWMFPITWLVSLGIFSLLPAVVYAGGVPDHRPFLGQCGELKVPKDATGSLVHIAGSRSTQPVTLFEDPLCPTCKAFHERLVTEDIYEKLDVQLALFPLDNSCNWMLDQALHPGACAVSRAILCAGDRAKEVLEWAYDEQEYLTRAGKEGEPTLRAVLKQRWGAPLLQCMDAPQTKAALNNHLHFAAENNIPVSTPQLYLNHTTRFCDEDTDIGLRFTMAELAPEVLR